ncbi:UNKNOWN [Stylonychia lemnae]|uniref:EF-hand domain-containing protein n=1 Tax=Stylonychia lemnae TaxID=5949 RepID=A0A078AIW6_STYLE|nr:UNKNOWN [Stylonychia lemnae]|eukprot:CDW80748.1 UNKNOWN [Stylonychia lemnae]
MNNKIGIERTFASLNRFSKPDNLLYQEELIGPLIDRKSTFMSNQLGGQTEGRKQDVLGDFMNKVQQNPRILRMVKDKARKRGIYDDGIDYKQPLLHKNIQYYDQRIRPFQSIEDTRSRQSMDQHSRSFNQSLNQNLKDKFIDEKILDEHLKNQKIQWYMQKFVQIEEEENQQRLELIRLQQQRRQFQIDKIQRKATSKDHGGNGSIDNDLEMNQQIGQQLDDEIMSLTKSFKMNKQASIDTDNPYSTLYKPKSNQKFKKDNSNNRNMVNSSVDMLRMRRSTIDNHNQGNSDYKDMQNIKNKIYRYADQDPNNYLSLKSLDLSVDSMQSYQLSEISYMNQQNRRQKDYQKSRVPRIHKNSGNFEDNQDIIKARRDSNMLQKKELYKFNSKNKQSQKRINQNSPSQNQLNLPMIDKNAIQNYIQQPSSIALKFKNKSQNDDLESTNKIEKLKTLNLKILNVTEGKNSKVDQGVNQQLSQKQSGSNNHLPLQKKQSQIQSFILDKNSESFKNAYKFFHNQQDREFDRKKFKQCLIQDYGLFGLNHYKRMKKNQVRLLISHDIHNYHDSAEKVMNCNKEFFQRMFFSMLDMNQDGKLCDVDLFKCLQELNNEKLMILLNDDIQKVLQQLSKKRESQGKSDSVRLGINIMKYHGNLAKEHRKPFYLEDRVEKAKKFFKLVMERQNRQNNPDSEPIEEMDSEDEQLVFNKLLNQDFAEGTMGKVVLDPQRMNQDYKLAQKMASKEINYESFQTYLMDQVDTQRVVLTFEEFQEIEFSVFGLPRISIEFVSKITGQNYENMIYKKIKKQNQLSKLNKRRGNIIQVLSDLKDVQFSNEEREILYLKMRLKNFDFDRYELVFRQLCIDPGADYDHELRMTLKSCKKGLKLIYGEQGNDLLALIMFNYFSKGLKNYEVKFSQFMYSFIAELDLDTTRMNHLVFKMLDEDKDDNLSILDLLRIYVNLPKYCAFNDELRVIFRFYLENSVKPPLQFRRKIDYNFHLYKILVPLSCLSIELKELFIDKVNKMEIGEKNPDDLDDYLKFDDYQPSNRSVFYDMRAEDGKDLTDDVNDNEIRKYFKLFGEKINTENIEEMCKAFLGQNL